MWKRLIHPNLVPLIGVVEEPPQIVSEWIPNGTLTKYVEKDPSVDRIRLVSFSYINHTQSTTRRSQVIGCCRRSQLPSYKPYSAWRPERGGHFLSVILNRTNDPRLAKRSRQPQRPRPFGRFWARLNRSQNELHSWNQVTRIRCEVGCAGDSQAGR